MRLVAASVSLLVLALVLFAGAFGECDTSDCGGVVYELWFDLAQVLTLPLATVGSLGLLFAAARRLAASARRD